jgi:hypothetical protein
MLAKVTGKNQLTLPKAIISQIGEVEYFNVQTEEGRIILTPVKFHSADAVRQKLKTLGITEDDVASAISSARHE